MDLGDMKVKVSADLTDLNKGLAAGGKNISDFAVDAAGSVSKVTKSFDSLDNTFESLRQTLHKKIDASGLDEVDINAKKASESLGDVQNELGRTVVNAQKSDAAFGVFSKSLSTLGGQLSRFREGLQNATNPESIARLNRAIAATEGRIKQINSIGADPFKKIVPGANSASFALTNLGRVAQDVPFGFIGIQNNLNPLLESFQRLKAETGSSGAALKALGSSLIGAGGLGFALSIASSAFLIFQNGFSSFRKKTKDASEGLEEYIKTLDDYSKANLKGNQSAAETQVKLDTLYNATQNANIPLADRKKLVDELQDQYPKYFKNISDETILAGGATKAYNDLSASILASARARAGQDVLIDIQKQILTLEQKETDNFKEQLKLYGKLKNAKKSPTKNLGSNTLGFAAVTILNEETEAADKLNQSVSVGNEIQKEKNALLLRAKGISDDITKGIVKNPSALLNPTGNIDKEKSKRDIETISDALAKLDRQIAVISQEEIIFNTDLAKDKISAIESTIKHLVDKFKLTASSSIILDLEAQVNLINFQERIKAAIRQDRLNPIAIPLPFEILFENSPTNEATLARAKKELEDQIGKGFGDQKQSVQLGVKVNPNLNSSDVADAKALAFLTGAGVSDSYAKGLGTLDFSKLVDNTEALLSNLSSISKNAITESLAGFGEELGKAIAGEGGNLFTGLFETLASGLQMFGKALIEYGVSLKILKSAIKNPTTAIIAGIGLVAFGAILKASIPKFAGGVQNFSGGFALVGERGPELVNLPRGSDVIPNNQLNGIGFGGGVREVPYIAEARWRGSDVIIGIKRATDQFNRNN